MPIDLIKAHAYGNDFLFVPVGQTIGAERAAFVRRLCDRHVGAGGDGLGFYSLTDTGAAMTLYNADGGVAEVSGNAVRCLAAIVARERVGVRELVVDTDAGAIPLTLVESVDGRLTFEALMGSPTGIRKRIVEAVGESIEVVDLSVGNPQCVLLGRPVTDDELRRIGPVLGTHPSFPAGTNVELVEVESSTRIRILIWERGVGPTEASGTGACASAVVAAVYGGASRDVDVVSPGGTQHVAWSDEGIRLTGWAEVVLVGRWHG